MFLFHVNERPTFIAWMAVDWHLTVLSVSILLAFSRMNFSVLSLHALCCSFPPPNQYASLGTGIQPSLKKLVKVPCPPSVLGPVPSCGHALQISASTDLGRQQWCIKHSIPCYPHGRSGLIPHPIFGPGHPKLSWTFRKWISSCELVPSLSGLLSPCILK